MITIVAGVGKFTLVNIAPIVFRRAVGIFIGWLGAY